MKGLVPRSVHPAVQLLMLLGLAVAGLCLAALLALVLVSALYGVSMLQFSSLAAMPDQYPHGWDALMLYQGLVLAGAGAGALLLPRLLGQSAASYFSPRRLGAAWWLGAAGLVIICSVPFLSALVSWNASAHFPGALHGFELWARDKEDQAAGLTKFLTDFNSPGRLLVGLLVIAIVPAVAEELVFRGGVQRCLVAWFGSRHVGVWLAAAIFSAIHVQFFGFVPRFVLGLVLGYLYEWSGNIVVSMAAHFTQNAFQLVLLYLAQGKHLPSSFDPDATQALPWPAVLASAVLTAGLLYWLHQRWAASPPAAPLSAALPGERALH
ncbi:CPBP family intramembrane glutamic endopeptidase [Hymenobacter cheonanensis]|uniref:CPBP family intramembrane glutamic endopeptidase n=1 Tax=Hymenobacter sp. CA2-7 TaxID=3063993 RepID=UPI00271421FB|nr:CPBP family intramembrane glutamic endopeptidase [Hymenobacter sp. CA2-7]MDO7884665.1 CPBP family intramembrane metalloprotease [Hymenobacter sp. CA2-7]